MAPTRAGTAAVAAAVLASSLLCSVAADAADVEGCPCFDSCSPADDPTYQAHGRDSCYRLSFARRTWAEALAACKRDGGTLVELSSESTLQYVTANYLPTVSVDTWVGARRNAGADPAPLWRWATGGEPVSAALVHPSVAAGSGGSGALCGFLPNSGAAAASLYGFSCGSLMGSLCQKGRTLFDASVTRLSAASALSMTEVAVALTGSGVPEALFLTLSTARCAEAGAAAEALAAKVAVSGVTSSGATLAVDSADLGVGQTYDVCWGLRDAAGAAGGRQARTGVRVAVAGLASLAAQDVLVQAAALGKAIEVTGSGITADVWGALFVAADCRGAASAPPTLVAPAAGADGARGAYATPAGLPADGVRRTLCVAASRNTPGLAAFSPTAVTVTPVPAPVLNARAVFLAYAESFAPHALVLQGQHLVQPGPWSVALFDTPLCQGAPRVADQAMVGCSESSCAYTLPSGAQSAGVVLHACARAGGPGYTPTGLTILGTPAPVFSDKAAKTIPVTYAEATSGEKVVELFGRNLETPGRPASAASSMLFVALVRSGVGSGSGGGSGSCSGAVVAFANLTAVHPAGARFRIPPGLGGDVVVCVAAASATPSGAGEWSAVFATGLALEVALPPVFDAAATPPVLLGWNARLGGDAGSATVPVVGVRFGTRHLWIRASTAAAGGCGGAGGDAGAMPAASATELRVPVASLLAAVPADAAAPTTVLLCWAAAAAAAAPPAGDAAWADSGVAIKALPRPLVNASNPAVPVVLTAHEAAAAAAARPRLQVRGTYLQASVMWACYARAPGGLGGSGGNAEGLVGVACLPAAAACGGQPGDAWCAQASFEVPPLAVGAYHVLLSLGRAAPAAVSAAAVPLGYTVEVAAPPSFAAASQAVSVGKLQDGFPLALKGTSVGEGAWVWFQAAAKGACAHPASDAAKLALVGDKRAAATTLAVPGRHPPLTGGGGRYKMCVSATRAAADSAAGETGVALEVSGPPVFHHITLTPSLGELWGSGGYRASLQGTNLGQADLWAAVCRADCTACTSAPFRLAAGGTLAVPPSASPTAAAGEPATMCFGTYYTSPSQLSPSSVRVAIPSVPALSAAPQLYPTGATAFNLTPAEGAASGSAALFVAGEVYASFCSGPWLPVAVAANQPPRFTPPTPPPPGVAQRVCLAFARADETPSDASPSFSTPLAVTRVGPPAAAGGGDGVPPQRVPLADIAAGEAAVAVGGANLWPGVWVAHVAADASCVGVPGGHLLDGARNGTAALYRVGPLEGGYPENMKLCWTGVGEDGQPLREAAAELGVRFTLQPMPTFDAVVPPLPVIAASTLLGGAAVAVEVRGTHFTNQLYLTLQSLADAADAAVDCGAASRIGAPLPLFKRSATAGFAAASGAALLGSGARAVGVCWLAAPADSSVAADAAAFPTGVRTALARVPVAAARAHTATLKSLAAGGVRLPVTGTDLAEDTAVWFGCGGGAALPPPARLSRAGGGSSGWELAVPATLAGPTRTEVALCVGVARTNDSVVVGAAAAAVGWRLLLSGVPEVLAWDGLAEPAASVRVRGSHLVPSASTTGVLLLFRPAADPCPSSPAGVAGAVEAPSNDFLLPLPAAAAAGDDLRLCVGLRTGGPFAATEFRVVLRVPPPVTPVPETPAPKTNAPPTDVPDTSVPETAVPDTPAPCPSPAEMGATLRDGCFYGSTGLVKCFRQTNQAGCEAGYLRCVAEAEGVHAPCYASPGSGSELRVLLPMDVGDFLHVLFRATVAASALVPPEYVSVRSVFPGSTVVTFSLAGDAGAAARLNHSLTGGTPIFAELGTGWSGAKLVVANNSTPVPDTPVPPAVVDNGGDSSGVGVGVVVLISVAALVAVLGCCTAVYCYRKSQLAEEEAAAAAAKEEEEGEGSRGESFGEGAGEGVRGPCGGLLSECLCGTGQCGCVFCTRAAAAGTGTVRTVGVASLGSTDWGGDELVESPEQTRPRTRLPSIPRDETPGGATSRSDGSFVPETLERALPPPEEAAAVRREWMLTPAGQRQRPAGGRGGGTVDVPPGSSVSGVSTAAATSPSTGGGGSRRRWMMDAPARNPLPPPGAPPAGRQTPVGVDTVCHVCRNLWEGGRYEAPPHSPPPPRVLLFSCLHAQTHTDTHTGSAGTVEHRTTISSK